MARMVLYFDNPRKKTREQITALIEKNEHLTVMWWEQEKPGDEIEVAVLGDVLDIFANNQEDAIMDFCAYMEDKLQR